jgi:hypothetical protein
MQLQRFGRFTIELGTKLKGQISGDSSFALSTQAEHDNHGVDLTVGGETLKLDVPYNFKYPNNASSELVTNASRRLAKYAIGRVYSTEERRETTGYKSNDYSANPQKAITAFRGDSSLVKKYLKALLKRLNRDQMEGEATNPFSLFNGITRSVTNFSSFYIKKAGEPVLNPLGCKKLH